jgi:hypothetical protein
MDGKDFPCVECWDEVSEESVSAGMGADTVDWLLPPSVSSGGSEE